MREFGIYHLKQSYMDKYSSVDPNLLGMGLQRPMICIKSGNQNWLLPMTSLDPDKPNYNKKKERLYAQLKQELQQPIKALTVLPDFLQTSANPRYQNIVYFSWALPVKKEDTIKMMSNKQLHCLPEKHTKYVKQSALRYIKEVWNGRSAGFMKSEIELGYDVSNFQRNFKALKQAVFSKQFVKKSEQKTRKEQAQKALEERTQRKKLRKEMSELIEMDSAKSYLISKGYDPVCAEKNAEILTAIAKKRQAGINGRAELAAADNALAQTKVVQSSNTHGKNK